MDCAIPSGQGKERHWYYRAAVAEAGEIDKNKITLADT